MNQDIGEIVRRVLPSYDVGLRLLLVLLLAMLVRAIAKRRAAHSGRPLATLVARVVAPLAILALTALLVLVGSPWGIDEPQDMRHLLAWNLYWITVLAIATIDGFAQMVYERRKQPFLIPLLLHRALLFTIYVGMALAILRYALGVDITPLLATSAILTAVVGLALQGVLGNLLSGVSLSLVRSVDVGNLIRVGETEGIVVRTNWRETILRTRDLDYVHVPNNVLASETFTNFSKPSMLHRHTIEVGASYSDPPANVIAALEEAAREAASTLERPPPVAHVTAYLDFGINYKLFFFSENYWSKLTVEGEVARLVWYKFKRRGIEIPFPMSDQLLNDFMAVVYNQRRIPPSGTDVDRMLAILSDSEFLVRPAEDGERRESIVSARSLRELAARCRLVRFTNGEWLCHQGDAGTNCYVVVEGGIDGSIEGRDGSPKITFRTEPGSVFGEMSLFTGMTRAATGTFSQETELLEIPRDAFAQLLASEERVMEEIAELVAARNRANADFLERAAAMPREEVEESCDSSRVLARLKSLASWGKRLLAGP